MGPANRQNFQGTRPAVPGAGSQSATSRMAAATAAVEETVGGSPTPFAPKGPTGPGSPTTTCGASKKEYATPLSTGFILFCHYETTPLCGTKMLIMLLRAGGRDPESP